MQTQKELPSQFLRGQPKIKASLVIASFGASTGYNSEAFILNITPDATVSSGTGEKALRYGKLPEIHHVFRADTKMPNILISIVFTLGAIAALPILLGGVSENIHHNSMIKANLHSGCFSEATSTIFPKHSRMHLWLMLSSWVRSLGWKVFYSCTIQVGTSSRRCQHLSLSVRSPS